MKFRDQVRYRLVDRTVDGITHQVRQRYTEAVPVLPRDWDQVAIRAAAALILGLTSIAIAWSTISIGALLGGGIGYAAACLFDVSWLTVLVLEWLARFHPGKRAFPRALGWLLVVLAAGAIFWHGMLAGSVAMATVGAVVSVVSKLLWLALFRHIDRELTEEDQEWVRLELSAANARLALASVRRQVARSEVTAAAELLSAERVRATFPKITVSGDVNADIAGHPAPERVSQPLSQGVSHGDEPPRLTPVSPQVSEGVSRVSHALDADTAAADRESEVWELTERLRAGEELSASRAADLLGVSRATAQRRLVEARERVARDGHAGYL